MPHTFEIARTDPSRREHTLAVEVACPGEADPGIRRRRQPCRCLQCLGLLDAIARLDPAVGAFLELNIEGARRVADESTARWRSGKPLSPIDGMVAPDFVAAKLLYKLIGYRFALDLGVSKKYV